MGSNAHRQQLCDTGRRIAEVLHRFVLLQNSIRTWRVRLFIYVDNDDHERKVLEISRELNNISLQRDMLIQSCSDSVEKGFASALFRYLDDLMNAVTAYAHYAHVMSVYQRGPWMRAMLALRKVDKEYTRMVAEYQKSGEVLIKLWSTVQNY